MTGHDRIHTFEIRRPKAKETENTQPGALIPALGAVAASLFQYSNFRKSILNILSLLCVLFHVRSREWRAAFDVAHKRRLRFVYLSCL